MKIYKFRGKDENSGKYVYGDLCNISSVISTPSIINKNGERIFVKSDSVAQLIGIDKNGNEIYEDEDVDVYKFLNKDMKRKTMKKYVCMNAEDLDFPENTLVIRWKPSHNGIVLTLDYNSTEDEHAAYTDFVKACNQAATDNVIPAVLGKTHWYDWEEITKDCSVPYLEEGLPKQYSVIWSPNDKEIVCNLHWESTYEDRFFAR